jgi:hypothetical protein
MLNSQSVLTPKQKHQNADTLQEEQHKNRYEIKADRIFLIELQRCHGPHQLDGVT